MSTANKLSYLNDTKSLLRTSLNKFGSSILSTDTFRSYDTKLNEIYDKLPKITQSGAGFTLSDVQNGLVDDFKMIGTDLEQNGTPSPSYPQEIKVVEGRQVINVKGKNLLNTRTVNDTQNGITISYDETTHIYTFNGTCTQDNTIFMLSDKSINFIAGVTKSITYWVDGSCANYCYMRHYSSGYSLGCTYPILELSENNPKIVTTSQSTFLNPTNLTSIRFNNGSVATNFKIKVMVTDDENTDYEPYYNPVSYNIDLQLANIYLAKMPNTDYKNRIYKNNGNWYFEENVRKYIFNSERVLAVNDYQSSSTGTSKNGTYSIVISDIGINVSNDKMMSEEYSYELNSNVTDNYSAQTNMTNNTFCLRQETNDRIYFKCSDYANKTASEISELIENESMYYVLANPVTTQITNTTLINQLEVISVHTGTNIITISNDNNIIPEIEITRLKELEKLA